MINFVQLDDRRTFANNFNELIDQARSADVGKVDATVAYKDMWFGSNSSGELTIEFANTTPRARGGLAEAIFAKALPAQREPSPFTEKGFDSLTSLMYKGVGPNGSYLKTVPADLAATHMNYWADQYHKTPTTFSGNWNKWGYRNRFGAPAAYIRTIENLDVQAVRYAGSQIYSPIGNGQMVNAIADWVDKNPSVRGNYQLVRSYVQRDKLDMLLAFADQTGTFNRIGIGMSNSEEGGGHFRLYGVVYTTTCDNSLRIYDGSMAMRHQWHDANSATVQALAYLNRAFQAAGMAARRLEESAFITIPDADDLMLELGEGFKIGSDLVGDMRNEIRRTDFTLSGIVNAMTRVAHTRGSDEDRELIEVSAGRLLMNTDRYLKPDPQGGYYVPKSKAHWTRDESREVEPARLPF